MELIRHGPDDPALRDILNLIQSSFAYMEGRIDPPSSMHHLTVAGLRDQATKGEVWSIGPPLAACVLLTPKEDALYVGKLCVMSGLRNAGLARRLIDCAAARAKALRLPALELQSRIELSEVHAAFKAMGFVETDRTAHLGYDNPTSITFRKAL